MPTQVLFDRLVENPFGSDVEDAELLQSAAAPEPRHSPVALSLHKDFESIESEWRAFEETADCTVFQTFDWLSTWMRTVGVHQRAKPAVVIGRQGDTVLFLMPFALETNGGLRKITWLGSHLSNYNGPMLAPDLPKHLYPAQFAEVWGEIKALLREWLSPDLIDLEKMLNTIGGQANPFCELGVIPHVNDAYLMAFSGTDWEAFYSGKRSSSTRKTDRKRRKRLAEHGETKFITASNQDDVVRTVDALIDEKRKSYAKLGVANMFEWPGYRDFFLGLASGAQSARLAHLSRLDVGGVTAAANFGLMFRGRYYYILAGYDDGDLSRFGPGSIQLMDVMGHAISHGCTLFDFTVGDEPYKREWCDTEVKLCDYVTPVSLRGCAAALSTVAFRHFKRSVKRNATTWPMIRKARMVMGSFGVSRG